MRYVFDRKIIFLENINNWFLIKSVTLENQEINCTLLDGYAIHFYFFFTSSKTYLFNLDILNQSTNISIWLNRVPQSKFEANRLRGA